MNHEPEIQRDVHGGRDIVNDKELRADTKESLVLVLELPTSTATANCSLPILVIK